VVAIANLSWDVDATTLAALITAGYDEWVVERIATIGPPPTWAEISHATTRPPLTEAVLRYLYSDASAPVDATTGLPNSSYRAVPRRASDGLLGTPVTASAKRRGYVTAQDVWDEGYANPPWTAAKVWRGIDRATATIDAICRQWFEPRYHQAAHDGNDHDQMWLDIPICALHRIEQDAVIVDLTDVSVYNRHLTRGQLNPDDRNNPRIAYSLDFPIGYRGRASRLYADAALFGSGRMNVVLKGVFGFTELGAGDFAAETEEGSQIPVSYGRTPADIARAALLLTLTYMLPAADQQEAVLSNRITRIKTRDQEIAFSDMASGGSTEASFGLTGNLEVDNILMRYAGPLRMGAAG
jgi:hypothetical protein